MWPRGEHTRALTSYCISCCLQARPKISEVSIFDLHMMRMNNPALQFLDVREVMMQPSASLSFSERGGMNPLKLGLCRTMR